jgi:hypothetical protein
MFMTLSFDEFRKRVIEHTREEDLIAEERDALQFLAMPGANVNTLTDETLERYIEAVGGIERWIELRSDALEMSDDSGKKRDVVSETVEGPNVAKNRGDGRSVLPIPKMSRFAVSRSTRIIRYSTAALGTAAALLLAISLWRTGATLPERQAGWTPTALADASHKISREASYRQLANLLQQLQDEKFRDPSQLQDALTDAYIGVHELRIRVPDFQHLTDADRTWLDSSCQRWGEQLQDYLAAVRKSPSDRNAVLNKAVKLLTVMREQLEERTKV